MARPVRMSPAFARSVERRRVRPTKCESKGIALQSQVPCPRLPFARFTLRNSDPASGARQRGHPGWGALLTPAWIPSLAVLLCGVLLHSMNVLLVATVLPSIVTEVGGAALMSWPTTAYLAFSIVAATCTSLVTAAVGPGRTFAGGAVVFCVGTLLCALA